MTGSARLTAIKGRARLRKWTILLTSGLAFLAPSAVAPGLPALQRDFAHVPHADILSALVLTMPMLFIALSGPPVGWAVDRFGRRNVLLGATVLYGLSGLSVLVLDTIEAILVSRALLGIFLAGIMTSVTALIGDYFTGEERNRVAGLQGAFMAFGTLTFVSIAGLLAEIHWRMGFTLFAVALLLVPLMLLSLYEPERAAKPAGSVAADGTVSVVRDGTPWRTIFLIYGLSFVTMIALFMIPSRTQYLLIEMGIPDPTHAGFAIGIFNFTAGFTSLFYRHLRARLSPEAIFALIYLLVGAGFVMNSLADSYLMLMLALAFGGFAMGAYFANLNLSVLSRATAQVRGRALGGLTTSFFIGQFCSPFYSHPLADAVMVRGSFLWTGVWLIGLGLLFVAIAGRGRLRRMLMRRK
jgi:MFS family permease